VILHAGLIARFDDGGWRGVLIQGPSGSGKSDLALRAIAAGWVMVSDDRTLIWRSGETLYGRPAPVLAGLIEARGLGVIGERHRPFAAICLAARCAAGEIERVPEMQAVSLLEATIPLIGVAALEASAPVKLDRALSHLGLRPQPAYQASRAGSPSIGGGRGPVRFPA
jgi:serine kinase of HPr protein (carbohydrate metabolism regulator)